MYTWDYRNRLTEVTSYTAGGTETQHVHYTYDVFNRMIGEQIDLSGDGTYDTTQRYVYDGNNVVLTLDGSGNVISRTLYGPQANQLLATENASGTVSWSLADQTGSVRDVISSSGKVLDHLVYNSFGTIVSQTSSANLPQSNLLRSTQIGVVSGEELYDFYFNSIDWPDNATRPAKPTVEDIILLADSTLSTDEVKATKQLFQLDVSDPSAPVVTAVDIKAPGQNCPCPATPNPRLPDAKTPLWYYILADLEKHGNGGKTIGPVGSRLVAEVLAGATQAQPAVFPGRLSGQIDANGDPRNVRTLFANLALSLHDSDLANFGPFAALYNTTHLGGGSAARRGSGTILARYENDNFYVTSLEYSIKELTPTGS